MFCLKCGEAIPDNTIKCPKCGANLNEDIETKGVVYGTQNISDEKVKNTNEKLKNMFYLWSVLGIISFFLLTQNYLAVIVDLYYGEISDLYISGFGLLECLGGTLALAGYMVIALIIVNIMVVVTGILGVQDNKMGTKNLNTLMMFECIAYLATTIIPYFSIINVLSEFNSKITTTSVGIGCYFNIVIAVAASVLYLISFRKQLSVEKEL